MRPEPVLSPEAHADVLHAAAFHEAQRSGFGYEFLPEFERATALIREAPLLSTLVELPVRRVLMRRFPYGVFFLPGSDVVADVVLAVVDLHQDPEVIRRAYLR
jgi:hypothetical protein